LDPHWLFELPTALGWVNENRSVTVVDWKTSVSFRIFISRARPRDSSSLGFLHKTWHRVVFSVTDGTWMG
jgi:hypothetical protein